MLVITILNRLDKHKGFVYGNASMVDDENGRSRIVIAVRARKNSRGVCSACGHPGPAYDRLCERSFQYVPLWGIPVVLLYALRRIDCRLCGVKVERVPWAAGKSPITRSLALFLAD